jgi:hypothetical protein
VPSPSSLEGTNAHDGITAGDLGQECQGVEPSTRRIDGKYEGELYATLEECSDFVDLPDAKADRTALGVELAHRAAGAFDD